MIWLTWRQFRAQALAAAAVLAALAVALAVTGPHLAHLYDSSGVPGCAAHGDCGAVTSNFFHQVLGTADKALFFIGVAVLYAAPPLMGAFWGAPLVAREIEAGTLRLAWNQSVTRGRWLAVKLGFIGLLAMATAGLASLLVSWWASPIYQAAGNGYAPDSALSVDRLTPMLFGANGIVPVGYAAFAFTLGVAAGIVIRRTIPAMAVALAGSVFVEFAWPSWVRSHLIAPVRQITASNLGNVNELIIGTKQMTLVTAAGSKPGAWIISNQTIDAAGHVFTGPPTPACLNTNAPYSACVASVAHLHLRQLLIYQPASRFWALQWYETGAFLALALVLAGFCAWWIGRRRLA
jgi:ABC-2 family transporter protein